jgi:proteasome lid subunit RPN8/RPN11
MIAYASIEPAGTGQATRVHRALNVFAENPQDARKRFEIDGKEVLLTEREFDEQGWELGAIYHSHTHTDPYPSQTDINFAANWPGLEWVIVGLAGEEAELRCYLIEAGEVREVPLHVS